MQGICSQKTLRKKRKIYKVESLSNKEGEKNGKSIMLLPWG